LRSMISEPELAFVLEQRVAHLATADAAGRPHVVPVCFAITEGCFWIPIDEKPKRTLRLRRLQSIEENSAVGLMFARYDDEGWSRLGWLMVSGQAAIIEAGDEHRRAIAGLRERYRQYREMALEERPVIKVTPERVTSWGTLSA